MKYQVMDGQTKQAVGQPMQSKARARAKAERLDLQYGAYRYYVAVDYATSYPTANDLINGLCRLGVL